MKKMLGILILAATLTGGAVYTVSSYNNSTTQINPTDLSTGDSQTKKDVIIEGEAKGQNENPNTTNNTPTNWSSPSSQLNNKIKRSAQDFKLKDLDGKEVSLNDLKGKKIFLNFWATWCPPCRAEMPEIEKLYQETKGSDLVILAVDIDEDRSIVKSFIDQSKYNFKVLLDMDAKVASAYNISSIPSSYFIDKEGNIVATHLGSMNLSQMKSYIDLLDR